MKYLINKCKKLYGEIILPGDKSITHRALMIGAISKGKTLISRYSKCKDCMTTFKILNYSGINIKKNNSELIIYGNGFSGFKNPEKVLNCENSGTTIRLMSGIFSTLNFKTILTGDTSLRKRPMDRIINPLKKMGAEITGHGNKGFPPLIIHGKNLKPVKHFLKIPSAQVKTALIFAALNTEGETEIEEITQSRDHTERMLKVFGSSIFKNNKIIKIYGKSKISGTKIKIPGDISSAAYFIASALLIDKSEILIKDVGINKTRIGFLYALKKMGAKINISNKRIISNEPIADITVKGSQELEGIEIKKDQIPFLIDELPLIAVIATQAKGKTIVKGAEELRIKESDRINAITTELLKAKAQIKATKDGFIVEGPTILKGTKFESYNDHRIAMSLTVAGLIAQGESIINNVECIDISFPEFQNYFTKLNCNKIIKV